MNGKNKQTGLSLLDILLVASILAVVVAITIRIVEAPIEKVSREKQRLEDAKPRLYSSSDECDTYKFLTEDGRWLYFARCGKNETLTQNNQTTLVGKTPTTKYENVYQEPK